MWNVNELYSQCWAYIDVFSERVSLCPTSGHSLDKNSSDESIVYLGFEPPSLRGHWLLCPFIFNGTFLSRFGFRFKGRHWARRAWGPSFRPLCGGALVGRRTAVLVQTDRAERLDGKTNLLSETHQQPVNLTPQLPAKECERNKTTQDHCKPALMVL